MLVVVQVQNCSSFFLVFRGVCPLDVRDSVDSLWTILVGAVLRFRVRGLD